MLSKFKLGDYIIPISEINNKDNSEVYFIESVNSSGYNCKSLTDYGEFDYIFIPFYDEKDYVLKSSITSDHISDKQDMVNHPKHYNSHPSGIECIEITRHYCFSVGNAIKYLWRAGLKTEKGYDNVQKEIEDLEKAIFYINDRIGELKKIKIK